jgi:putative colanic acid biosynthesis acetyltransferase WcaF
MTTQLDIAANRNVQKWTPREQLGRVLWALAQPLFRYSPKICWPWRRQLLRLFGATIGRDVHVHPSVRIEIPWNLELGNWSAVGFDVLVYNLGIVRIGERVTISHRAHLCAGTHDSRDPAMTLQKLPITIRDDAWICADSFVGPGVEVGPGAIVGARAVVVKNVEAWSVVVGNPSKTIGRRSLLGAGSREC